MIERNDGFLNVLLAVGWLVAVTYLVWLNFDLAIQQTDSKVTASLTKGGQLTIYILFFLLLGLGVVFASLHLLTNKSQKPKRPISIEEELHP